MNSRYKKLFAAFALLCVAASCRPSYEVVKVEGETMAVDSTWDATPDEEALALLAPYKSKVDSMMQQVIGHSATDIDRFRPESPLSNLVADVLREAATPILGHPADMGQINIGGIRNSLPSGPITTAHIYEILPFENSLCILTLKGSVLKSLFGDIARRGGEGVSGVKLEITRDGKLLSATVAGKAVQDTQLYTVATIDYLAEGNGGMESLIQAEKCVYPPNATLRDLFMRYVKELSVQGKSLDARLEGRIVIND